MSTINDPSDDLAMSPVLPSSLSFPPLEATGQESQSPGEADALSDRSASDDSVPSLVSVSPSELSPSSPIVPVASEFNLVPIDAWTDPTFRPRLRSRAAHINIVVHYPTLLAEVVGRCLIKLEVVAMDTPAGRPQAISVHLPTTLDAAHARPAAVWQSFWRDIVASGLFTLLTRQQRQLIQDIILIFRHYNVPHPDIGATWENFAHVLYLAAETGACFATPGEEVLHDLVLWARLHIPDAFPPPLVSYNSDLDHAQEEEEDLAGSTSEPLEVSEDELLDHSEAEMTSAMNGLQLDDMADSDDGYVHV